MNKQKIGSILIVIFLASTLTLTYLPLSSASPVTIKTISGTYTGVYGFLADVNAGQYNFSGMGQVFTATNTGYLQRLTVSFFIPGMDNTHNAYFTCNLYNVNASGYPVGVTIAGATNLIIATGTGSDVFPFYTFAFDGTCQLTSGQSYAWIVNYQSCTGAAPPSNYPSNIYKLCYLATAGTQLYWDIKGGQWVIASNSWSFIFTAYGDTTASPTPTPTPSPSPTPTGNPYQYWNGTHWVPTATATPEPNIFDNGTATPYIQMLVPVIILAVAALLGWKFAGAWGFFAGLNIGAVLTYAILGSTVFPLWGLIVLFVIDGLLLFGKVGFRS